MALLAVLCFPALAQTWASLSALPRSSHLDAGRLHLVPSPLLRAQMAGGIKWTQAQDCSLEKKTFRMFKNYFCGKGNQVGQREAISQLHGFGFQRKERSFGVGVGEEAASTAHLPASLQFTLNSWQVHLSIGGRRGRLEKE